MYVTAIHVVIRLMTNAGKDDFDVLRMQREESTRNELQYF